MNFHKTSQGAGQLFKQTIHQVSNCLNKQVLNLELTTVLLHFQPRVAWIKDDHLLWRRLLLFFTRASKPFYPHFVPLQYFSVIIDQTMWKILALLFLSFVNEGKLTVIKVFYFKMYQIDDRPGEFSSLFVPSFIYIHMGTMYTYSCIMRRLDELHITPTLQLFLTH